MQLVKAPSRLFSIFISLVLVLLLPVMSAVGVSALGRAITNSRYLTYTQDRYNFSFEYPRYRSLIEYSDMLYIGYDGEPRVDIREDSSVKDSWRNFDNVGSADEPIINLTVQYVDYSKPGEYDYRTSEKDIVEIIDSTNKESTTYSSLSEYQGFERGMIDGKDAYIFKEKQLAVYNNLDWYSYEYFVYKSNYEFSIRITYSDSDEGLRQRDYILESIDLPE